MDHKIPEVDRIISGKNAANVTRRRFISSCSACAACLAFKPAFLFNDQPGSTGPAKKLRLKIIYSLTAPVQVQPDWPNVGLDIRPVMQRTDAMLKDYFTGYEFVSETATGKEEAEKIVLRDSQDPVDGYIVYQLNCWNRVVQTIAATGKPVLYVDFQFGGSGGFLSYTAAFLSSAADNVGFVASSKPDDLLAAVACYEKIKTGGTPRDFVNAVSKTRTGSTPPPGHYSIKPDKVNSLAPRECLKQLGSSKILAVRDQNASKADPVMGIQLEFIPYSEINDAWASADKNESGKIVQKWKKTALEIAGITDDTLLTSAAMYLGMKSVLKKYSAEAITINCLGGFYGGYIHAYPCLGFHELNNEGLVGGCECDINSAATMLAFSKLAGGRPGFISDPVIDTSKRQIIYAHCVAPNRIFGPKGKTNPFRIMTHSEDRSGASVQSILPVDYITTSLQINNSRKEILMHQAISVDNDPDDRACRTKLCAEPVGDIEKLFTKWDKWGWHRVTFYGDLKEPVNALAAAMGWKVIEEA